MKSLFSSLFPNGLPDFDIVGNPFAENITAKRILYPTNVCGLTNRQYSCLQTFLVSIGETYFYLSDTFSLNGFCADSKPVIQFHRDTSFKEYDKCKRNPVTILLSERATWGIVISDNEYAIVGTIMEYAEHMHIAFQPCDKEQVFFLNNYAKRSNNPTYAEKEIKRIISWLYQ